MPFGLIEDADAKPQAHPGRRALTFGFIHALNGEASRSVEQVFLTAIG